MKLAVYTICKNEAKFVKRFMACLKNEADAVFVTDTGSSDDTVKLLRAEGAHVDVVKVDPWRFDVARNISLDFVPSNYDVCLSIDLDEVLTPGWAKAIKQAFQSNNYDRLRYKYVWNHLPDGSDGTTFWYEKCHRRNGFRWVKPVHEILEFYEGTEHQGYCEGFTLHHWADQTKSRGSYLGLLELGVKEQPNDDRNCHYLGREYMYYRRFDEAIAELTRHLALPTARWNVERAASMRFLARCFRAKGDVETSLKWNLNACAEAPKDREPWVELGKLYYSLNDHVGCYYAMRKALEIVDRPMTYICELESWDSSPYDLAGVSAYYLGMYEESRRLTLRAIEMNPTEERLKQNLRYAQDKIGSTDAQRQ